MDSLIILPVGVHTPTLLVTVQLLTVTAERMPTLRLQVISPISSCQINVSKIQFDLDFSIQDTSIREAINHALKVSREGNCKIPKPRLVRVQDYYPHPGKTYVPHCTILHQCSDDTGCCRHDVLTCSPKTTQRVELYFYVRKF